MTTNTRLCEFKRQMPEHNYRDNAQEETHLYECNINDKNW